MEFTLSPVGVALCNTCTHTCFRDDCILVIQWYYVRTAKCRKDLIYTFQMWRYLIHHSLSLYDRCCLKSSGTTTSLVQWWTHWNTSHLSAMTSWPVSYKWVQMCLVVVVLCYCSLPFFLTVPSDCIIEALANPEKEKMKHDDTAISSWLQSAFYT